MDFEFKGKYVISGKLVCETGLHIGGAAEGFEIAGLDNPVIRDPLTDYPYIPGSSLKGKLRHLLEWSLGKNPYSGKPHHFTEAKDKVSFEPCSCGRCEACVLFGTTPEEPKGIAPVKEGEELGLARAHVVKVRRGEKEEEKTYRITGPARLTVRDAFPTEETIAQWKQYLGENIYTELKVENALDRVTAEANPRTMERVPAGSEFAFEMIFDLYREEDKALLKSLFMAMHLLENSALGGSGSRGHGKVKFAEVKVSFRSLDYYLCKVDQEEVRVKAERDNLKKPTKHVLSGRVSGEVPCERSLVKFLGGRLDDIV
jgi:CRISPR-associated protein Csm3